MAMLVVTSRHGTLNGVTEQVVVRFSLLCHSFGVLQMSTNLGFRIHPNGS